MKNFTLIIFIIFFSLQSYAQTSENTGTSFGILGGVNFQNLNGEDSEGDKLTNEMLVGFHAGLNVQIPIAPQFYLQPGLLFSTKGAKDSGTGYTSQVNLSYIEVPIEFVYKGALGSGYVMIGLGPYFGYGIMGKYKLDTALGNYESDVEFTNSIDDSSDFLKFYVKSFDAGGNVFAGYELQNGLFFRLNTQLGMININPDDNRTISSDKGFIKHTGFGLSLGYRF